jgi:hypothetical protein
MSQVARRELASRRSLGLGTVAAARANEGGSGEHYLDCDIRLHGCDLLLHNVPVAVGRVGLSALPRPGDLVVVGFVEGDVNGPVVIGSLNAAGAPPPAAAPDEVVYAVPDDLGDSRRLELRLPNGNRLTVKDSLVEIVMGNTTLKVEADGAITLQAASDVTIKASGSLSLEAATTATLKGASVSVEASGPASLKGATTAIAGLTSFRAG